MAKRWCEQQQQQQQQERAEVLVFYNVVARTDADGSKVRVRFAKAACSSSSTFFSSSTFSSIRDATILENIHSS